MSVHEVIQLIMIIANCGATYLTPKQIFLEFYKEPPPLLRQANREGHSWCKKGYQRYLAWLLESVSLTLRSLSLSTKTEKICDK